MSASMIIKKFWSEWLVISAVLVNVGVALSTTYFPYTDIVNHLARYVLIHDAWLSGSAPAYFETTLVPSAYIGVDLLGVALVHLFSPEAVMRLLALLYLTALPLGAYLLARAVAPPQRALAVVAALLSFNWYFLLGFANYVLGIAFALILLSWWWPRRARMSPGELILFGSGCAALHLIHMAGAALVLAAAGIEYAQAALNALRERGTMLRRALKNPTLPPLVVGMLSVGALWFAVKLATPAGASSDPLYLYPLKKIHYLFAPFYSFSVPQAALMAGAYFGCLGLFLWLARPDMGVRKIALLPATLIVALFLVAVRLLSTYDGAAYYYFSSLHLALLIATFAAALGLCWWKYRTTSDHGSMAILPAALVLVYVLFPVGLFGGYYVDVRFLLPAYLLVFFIPVRTEKRRAVMHVAHLLWIGSVLHAGVVYFYAHDIDRNLHDFRRILAEVPQGENVLAFVADRDRYGKIPPYRHFALWRVADRAGRAPGLFSADISGQQLAHFRVTAPLYYPNELWGTKVFGPLDWKHLATDYRYVIQAGADPRVTSILEKHATVIERHGEISLHHVHKHATALQSRK